MIDDYSAMGHRFDSNLVTVKDLLYFSTLVFLFILPIRGLFTISASVTIGKVVGVLVGVIWIISVLKHRSEMALHKFHLVGISFVSFPILSILWSSYPPATTLSSLRNIFLVGIILILSYTFASRKSIKPPLYAYTLGALILCLLLLANYLIGNSFTAGRYTVGSLNPNSVAFSLVFSIPCISYLGRSGKRKRVRIFLAGAAVIISLGIVLTGSRTAYVGLASIFFYYTMRVITLRPKRSIPAIAIFTVVSVGFLYFLLPAEILSRFSSIPQEVLRGDLASRTVQWSAGFELLKSNPILGVGLGAFPGSVEPIIGYSVATDNTYLQILYELGLIGIIFSAFLLRTVVSTVLNSQSSYMRIEFGSLVACCLVMALANDLAYHPILWSLLALFASGNIQRVGNDMRK
ncbi:MULTISPECIES: O-antigen ligase family protein [Haloarcula]|uniref:O-antigen ligase family protein n=1 Tax=Haloarcula TaxID=2237 RepID=UPI0011B36217|nr:O-antigen ligase family protein [Haloarcula hispanica]